MVGVATPPFVIGTLHLRKLVYEGLKREKRQKVNQRSVIIKTIFVLADTLRVSNALRSLVKRYSVDFIPVLYSHLIPRGRQPYRPLRHSRRCFWRYLLFLSLRLLLFLILNRLRLCYDNLRHPKSDILTRGFLLRPILQLNRIFAPVQYCNYYTRYPNATSMPTCCGLFI